MPGKTDRAWYRSAAWDPEAERQFRQRLGRARSDFAKAQYTRIKATYLLASQRTRSAAKSLLREVLADYPSEAAQVLQATEELGTALEEEGAFTEAEVLYRSAIQLHRERLVTTGWTHRCKFKLARLIVASKQAGKYQEAQSLLDGLIKWELPFWNSEIFEHAVLRARLTSLLGQPTEAATWARRALDVSKVTIPQARRHPNIGLVQADQRTLAEMGRLAGKPGRIG